MTDTPQPIKDLQLDLWLSKTPGERLYQFLIDNDAMYQALREFKLRMGLPLTGLDPVSEYLKKKKEKIEQSGSHNVSSCPSSIP